jgi:hypothetical protein
MNRRTKAAATTGRTSAALVARVVASLAAVTALVAVFVSASVVWLCLTQPLTVANAVGEGQMSVLVRAVAGLALSIFQQIVRYL